MNSEEMLVFLFVFSYSQSGDGDRTIDPKDDCTFWYVNEYYSANSQQSWQTRIGKFRLKGC